MANYLAKIPIFLTWSGHVQPFHMYSRHLGLLAPRSNLNIDYLPLHDRIMTHNPGHPIDTHRYIPTYPQNKLAQTRHSSISISAHAASSHGLLPVQAHLHSGWSSVQIRIRLLQFGVFGMQTMFGQPRPPPPPPPAAATCCWASMVQKMMMISEKAKIQFWRRAMVSEWVNGLMDGFGMKVNWIVSPTAQPCA